MQHFGQKYPLSLFESDIRREVSKIWGGGLLHCYRSINTLSRYLFNKKKKIGFFISLPTKLLLVILEKRLKFN